MLSVNRFLKNLHILDVFFILLLLVGFLLRLNVLSSTGYTEDGSRNYLVANHIVTYHEFPLTGPLNLNETTLRNSPFYYYFLSFFLLLKNDYAFLSLTHVVLQTFTVGIIYVLARKMFDVPTAFIAGTLFNFSETILLQSQSVTQPWVMQPFIYVSFLLLFISYVKKRYLVLLLSMFVFALSTLLHRSAIAVLPVFVLSAFFILYKQKGVIWHYAGLLIPAVLVILAHLPLLMYYHNITTGLTPLPYGTSIFSPSEFTSYFLNSLTLFMRSFFSGQYQDSVSLNTVYLFLTASVLFYFFRSVDRHRKKYVLILIIFFLQPMFFSSLFKLQEFRYLAPSLGLFTMLLAVLINSTPVKDIVGNTVKIILTVMLLTVFSPNLYAHITNEKKIFSYKEVPQNTVANLIDNEVRTQASENTNLYFFDFHTIRDGYGEYNNINAAFWIALEKNFNAKLTVLDDSNMHSYRPIATDKKLIFLNCYRYANPDKEKEECLNVFLKQNPEYRLVRNIYSTSPFSIYLTKK